VLHGTKRVNRNPQLRGIAQQVLAQFHVLSEVA